MVNMSSYEFAMFEAKRGRKIGSLSAGVPLEIPLHDDIIKFCNSQFPRWKFIHANPAVPSTIQKGCQDFTIFAPGRVLCVECKARNEKPDSDQQIWHKEMEMNGYTVHVVRNMEQFLELTKENE
jgi:hypothetical protein